MSKLNPNIPKLKINDPSQLVIMRTDNVGCVALYNKMRKTGVPSINHMRINKFFAAMIDQNFKLEYIPASGLVAVDFLILRTQSRSPECPVERALIIVLSFFSSH